MTTPLDIPAIVARARAAQAARHGPWRFGDWDAEFGTVEDPQRMVVLEHNMTHTGPEPYRCSRADGRFMVLRLEEPIENKAVADHIAGCDPTTVLALTGRIAALEDELHRLRGSHQRSIEATREAVTGLDDHGRAHMVVACRAAVTRCFCGCHVSTTDEATPLRNLATNTESKEE